MKRWNLSSLVLNFGPMCTISWLHKSTGNVVACDSPLEGIPRPIMPHFCNWDIVKSQRWSTSSAVNFISVPWKHRQRQGASFWKGWNMIVYKDDATFLFSKYFSLFGADVAGKENGIGIPCLFSGNTKPTIWLLFWSYWILPVKQVASSLNQTTGGRFVAW